MNPNFDLYLALGVSSNASQDDIKAAYRSAARRLHPDVNPHEGAALQFRDVAAAYEILSNDEAHARYRRTRQATGQLKHFTVRTVPSKRSLPVISEPHVLYLLLEIAPSYRQSYDQPGQRSPLNVSLVLDRSSSMRGIRMERVKAAARQTVDRLNPEDRLSIVTFSDKADVLVKSETVTDGSKIKAVINTITPGGGTEIFQGLSAGFQEVKRHFNRKFVNHVILITDGRTYGDENQSLELADQAKSAGIGISAMGIGEEWNDTFLDSLASRTGGSSTYVSSPAAVVQFLDDRMQSLGQAYAERMHLTIAPDPDVHIESIFRLVPAAQPLEVKPQPIQLGTLQSARNMLVLLQMQMPPNMKEGFRTVARLDVTGDVMGEQGRVEYKAISDQSVEVSPNPAPEDPPPVILDALGKLTLYRMQQKAEMAINEGRVMEATRRLENLATRLLEGGHAELADLARMEARRVSKTNVFSEEGRRTLKFGTRALMLPAEVDLTEP